MAPRTIAPWGIIVLLAACGGDGDRVDAGADASADGSAEAVIDVGRPEVQEGGDADSPDAPVDAGSDTQPSPDADAADVPSDLSFDPDPGPDADAQADVEAPNWDPDRVTVMLFNLRTAFGDTDADAWEHRRDLVIRVARDAAPDVLGTQETTLLQWEALDGALEGYERVGRTRTESLLDEACSIWFRSDRFELLDSGTFQLSDTPDVPGSFFEDADQKYPRIVTWVRLRDRAGGFELAAFNTHWGYEQVDDIQPRSAVVTLAKMAEIAPDVPAVLSGDFNCGPGQAGWEILVGNETFEGTSGDLVDPWVELGLPEGGTFHGFTGIPGGKRIDNVFHTPGVRALDARIVTDHDGERYPSDHFPIRVVFEGFQPAARATGPGNQPREAR